MLDTATSPTFATPLATILDAEAEAEGGQVHPFADVVDAQVDSLLDLFARNDEVKHQARRGSARRASVLLTAMIEAESVQPELSSFSSVIMAQSKAQDGSAQTAMDVLAKLRGSGDAEVAASTVIVNAVLNAHAKCHDGSARAALALLREMRGEVRLDSISYNTCINCFAKCKDGSARAAMGVFQEMLKEGITPTAITYYSLLSAQRSQPDGTSANALRILDHVVRTLGTQPDETMLSTAIGLQARVEDGSGRAALALVGRMKQSGFAITAKLLNCVIDAQAKNDDGSARVALTLLDSMKRSRLDEVRPSVVTYTSVIDCQAKCSDGDGRTATALLEEMVTEGLTPNSVTYLCCLNAQARHGSAKMALAVLQKLRKQGLAVTHSQYNSAISACAKCGDGSGVLALQVLDDMDSSGAVPSALSYSMCVEAQATHDDGTAYASYELINRMLKHNLRVDGATFNHAINVQSKKADGTARAAVALFQAMSGLMDPNLHAYNIVLNACATQRPAALELAKSVLDKMLSRGFSPNTYTMSALLRCAAFADSPEPSTARRWFAEFCCCDGFEANDHVARALRAALGDEAEDMLARAGGSRSRAGDPGPGRRVVVRRKSGSPTLDRRSIRSRNSQSTDWRGSPARKSSWRADSPPRSRSPTTPPAAPKSRSLSAPFIVTGLSGLSGGYTPPSSPGLGSPRMSLVDKIRSLKQSAAAKQHQQRSSALLSPDFFGAGGSSVPTSPSLSPSPSPGCRDTFPRNHNRRCSSSDAILELSSVLAPVEPRKVLMRRRSTRSSLRSVEGVVREPSGPDGTRGFGRRRSSQLFATNVSVGVIG